MRSNRVVVVIVVVVVVVCVCVGQVGKKESVQITIWTVLKVETPIRNSSEWAIGCVSLDLSIASGLEIEI